MADKTLAIVYNTTTGVVTHSGLEDNGMPAVVAKVLATLVPEHARVPLGHRQLIEPEVHVQTTADTGDLLQRHLHAGLLSLGHKQMRHGCCQTPPADGIPGGNGLSPPHRLLDSTSAHASCKGKNSTVLAQARTTPKGLPEALPTHCPALRPRRRPPHCPGP